jgi:hypothetical protein
MKDLDPFVFIAVFQEMLGWLFWPLVIFIVLGAVAFLAVLIRDRGINARRLVFAELVGVAGGFVGIWLMLAITNSQLKDMGGPIDWLLVAAIWVAGAIGATVVAYIVLAAWRGGRQDAAPSRLTPT